MGTLLGLAAALTYGSADFLGGLITRRTGALRAVLWSQVAGLALAAALLPCFTRSGASAGALGWGAASGIAGGSGVVLLYRGLSIGRMSVVAPVTGVIAAAVPVAVSMMLGERPSALALVGVAVALVAVVLISAMSEQAAEHSHATPAPAVVPSPVGAHADGAISRTRGGVAAVWRQPGALEALGAGVSFGVFFLLLARAGTDAGMWPMIGVRTGSLTLVAALALARRQTLRVPRSALWPLAVVGGLDMFANLLFLLATATELVSLAAVLTSLYPAATVLLARIVLGERMTPPQLVGLGFAALGVALIGLG
ncbi:MAG TPA: DMT family transporter [Egibacteraceae bacterium]|nr:DMT family transporter [Egibacteraceae bacterium]